MTNACPTWELAADTCLLKLKRLQNKVFRTIWNFPRCTPILNLHTAFNLRYVYVYITKLCSQQAEIIQNHEKEHIRSIRQSEARQKIWRRSSLWPFKWISCRCNISNIGIICFAKPGLTENLIVQKEEFLITRYIIRDKPIFSSERMLHKDYYRKGPVKKKSLVVILEGLGTKTNWLAVNCQSLSNFDFDFDFELQLVRGL
jgi:hypothetical protein